jgi:hypothetical protein
MQSRADARAGDGRHHTTTEVGASASRSLLVVLDGLCGSNGCRAWLLGKLSSRPSLTEKVPTLIERHLDFAQPRHHVRSISGDGVSLLQSVLFSYESCNLIERLLIVHTLLP